MAEYDLTDPHKVIDVPFATRLGARGLIAMDRYTPFDVRARSVAYQARVRLAHRPSWRRRMLRRLRGALGTEMPDDQLAECAVLAQVVRRMGVRTYAPVFQRSRQWLLTNLMPEGLEHLEALRSAGSGALLLGTGVGMKAWSAEVLLQLGFDLHVIQREHVSAEKLLMMRADGTLARVLAMPSEQTGGAHLKDLLDLLRRGGWIQQPGQVPAESEGIACRYLGRPIRTNRGPWILARLSRAPIVPVFVLMGRDFTCRLVVEEPLHVGRGAQSPESACQAYHDVLTRLVRAEPWNLLPSTHLEGLLTDDAP